GEEARLLEKPNNVLGVEYLKALFFLRSSMIPMTTLRTLTQHDAESVGPTRSAGQLRSMLEAGEDILGYVPEEARPMLRELAASGRGPVTMERLEVAILSRLRQLGPEDFHALPDATEGLGNRLYRAVRSEESVEAILSAVKTKRYPLSRLRRMVLCAALNVRADTGAGRPGYARLLASTERGRELLRAISENIQVVTKPADGKNLPPEDRGIFELTANARDFYVLGFDVIGERKGGSDWRTSPVTL
ncbi:MAG: nucleotidyltransferase family protein, partial [Oscillospiraceae bacterium]|nr:nucleotidyltransferase family protein [Oscillospiraceae bacterium]